MLKFWLRIDVLQEMDAHAQVRLISACSLVVASKFGQLEASAFEVASIPSCSSSYFILAKPCDCR